MSGRRQGSPEESHCSPAESRSCGAAAKTNFHTGGHVFARRTIRGRRCGMRKLSIAFLLLLAPLVANGQPYHVGGDVKGTVAISPVTPVYPEEARRERISGIVILETLVDHPGGVKEVSRLKPLPHGLSEAAV